MKKDITFEEAMLQLEDIVSKLELGNLTLDGSIKEFESAMGLVSICEKKLESAKQKVKILTENQDGSVTDSDFVKSDDET